MARIKDPIETADQVIRECDSRNPIKIASIHGIWLRTVNWFEQSGAYAEIARKPIIYVSENLHPVMKNIVIAHELGHHFLHRGKVRRTDCFCEVRIFDMTMNTMEHEANIFAAQLMLPDDEIIDYIYQGFDIYQIASVMKSDVNLVALKVSELKSRGQQFKEQEYKPKFF